MSCGDLQHTSSSSVVSCQFYVVYVNNEWIVVKQLWQISATMLTRHNNAHCSVAGLQILATKILKSDNILYLLPGSSVWSVLKRHWHKNFGLAFFCRNKLLEHVSHNTALCLGQHVTDNNYSLFITKQSQFRFRRAPRMTSYWVHHMQCGKQTWPCEHIDTASHSSLSSLWWHSSCRAQTREQQPDISSCHKREMVNMMSLLAAPAQSSAAVVTEVGVTFRSP